MWISHKRHILDLDQLIGSGSICAARRFCGTNFRNRWKFRFQKVYIVLCDELISHSNPFWESSYEGHNEAKSRTISNSLEFHWIQPPGPGRYSIHFSWMMCFFFKFVSAAFFNDHPQIGLKPTIYLRPVIYLLDVWFFLLNSLMQTVLRCLHLSRRHS